MSTATIPVQKTSTAPVCKACGAALDAGKSLGIKNGYALLPCASCGTVTVDPFPTADDLHAFYQAYKGTCDYRAKRDKKIARAKKRIRRLMKLTPGRRFLDVGSNYGFTVKAARDLGLDGHGIDIDGVAVAAAAQDFGPYFSNMAVQSYAAHEAKADIVYTAEVVEHVPDPDAFIGAIAKILDKGGLLYLTTPECGHWAIPRDFVSWKAVMPPEHITYFTRKGIAALLARHGLKVERFSFSWKPGMRLVARKA